MMPDQNSADGLSQFLSRIVESTDDAIIGLSADGIVFTWNKGAEKVFGYPASEAVGKPISFLVTPDTEDDVPAILDKIKAGERVERYHSYRLTRDGSQIFVAMSISPVLDGAGRIIGASIIARDISRQKQIEEKLNNADQRLRHIFRYAPVSIFEIDIETMKLVRANEFTCKFSGFALSELMNMNAPDLLSETSRKIFIDRKSRIVAGESIDPGMEYEIKAKTGAVYNIHVRSIYIPDEGRCGTLMAFAFDITESKQKEDSLKEELAARAHFVDVLAHELRGPLSPVVTSSEMLADFIKDSSDNVLKRLAANILDGANTLSERLDDLLDVARYSRGVFTLNTRPTDVVRFINDVAARYKPKLDESRHTLVLNIAPSLPSVDMDASRMEQVLINFLSNAGKYSPRYTRIELSARAEEGSLYIEVKDEGPGISELDQRLLFQPYHRLQKDLNKVSGLGLGLTICKHIAEAHGGRIAVSSKLGTGSTFSVVLPLPKTKV
jgi:PAS domain S-box-containing protein